MVSAKYGFNYLLKSERRRINFFNRKKGARLFVMALTRFGNNFVWVPVVAYRNGDYYFTDPKSELGVVRFTLPDREFIEEIRGGGYAGLLYMVIPTRDSYYFIKVNKHDIQQSLVKVKAKDENGEERWVTLQLKDVISPTLKIKKGFFEQASEIAGYKMLTIQSLTDLQKEREAKMKFLDKWGPTLTNIFVIVVIGVIAYLLVGRIEEATNAYIRATHGMTGLFQHIANVLTHNSTSTTPPTGGNW